MRRIRWLTPGLMLVVTGLTTALWSLTRPSEIAEGLSKPTRYAALAPTAPLTVSNGSRSPASLPNSASGNGDGGAGQAPPILSFMKKNFPGNWVANYNDRGVLNGVTGGRIPKGAPDAARAYQLAVELGKLQGLRQEELDSSNRYNGQSEVQEIYEFQQTHEGYKVFGSSIRMNAAKADGTVFHVSTSLAEITGSEFSLGLQKADVDSAIRRLYPGRNITGVKFVEESPVIWARTSPQELAWIVNVDFKDEKLDRIRVVLGSNTGTIRGESDLMIE